MTMSEQLKSDIQILKSELQISLTVAEQGSIVDISRIPDRLVNLHSGVARLDKPNQQAFGQSLEELLQLLDKLSQEIHKKYEDISQQIKMLDE